MNLKVFSGIPLSRGQMATGAALTAAYAWSFWTTFRVMAEKWSGDPQYSHGWLVPLFSLALLWLRREMLIGAPLAPNWAGAVMLSVGVMLRLAGAYFYFEWFDFLSIVPCVAGTALLLGGWKALHWSWPAIGFLFFMMPLPFRLEVALRYPLQRIATVTSTYILQTVGVAALSEGNVIVLNDVRIGVVEACSGLRMLVVFFAISTAVALLIRRPLWERLFVLASAAPIALIVNIARITATGILHQTAGSEIANAVFHDIAGLMMMPLALLVLWFEMWLLSHLLVEPEAKIPMFIPGRRTESVPEPLQTPAVR